MGTSEAPLLYGWLMFILPRYWANRDNMVPIAAYVCKLRSSKSSLVMDFVLLFYAIKYLVMIE